MKIIRKLDAEIENLIFNQLEVYGYNYDDYKESPYIHNYVYKNKKYILNLLTNEILELDIIEEIPIEYAIKKYYKFYKDLDPYTIASIVVKFNIANQRTYLNPTDTSAYTILTTTGCNARCPYCFEQNRVISSMSEETALDVAKYIADQYSGGLIELAWFGGEPMLNTKVIDIITNYLDEQNIKFTSQFTTNGSKLKDIDYYKLYYKWRTAFIQVTLDGLDAEYDRIKNYSDNSTFKDIKEGLDKLIGFNIQVGLRINISPDKEEFLKKKQLARWIVDNYGSVKNFNVNTASLYDIENHRFTKEERNRMIEYELEIHTILSDSNIYYRRVFFPTPYREQSSCVVQSRSGITIDTNGNFQQCEYYSNASTSIGNIYEGFKDLNWLKKFGIQKLQDKCKHCKYYPACNYLEVCHSSGNCDTLSIEALDSLTEEYLRELIEGKRYAYST